MIRALYAALLCVTNVYAYVSTSLQKIEWNKDAVYQHDATCFTQGLMYVNTSVVLETCGLYGESRIHFYDMFTNKVLLQKTFPDEIFAEGVCRVGDFVYVLTWRENCILKLEYFTLDILGCIYWDSEGWGMTFDNNDTIFITDGSHFLTYVNSTLLNQQAIVPLDEQILNHHKTKTIDVNPDMQLNTQQNQTLLPYVIKKLPIYCNKEQKPTVNLNELEYINGSVYANVWQTRYVVRIKAETSECDAVLNFENGYTGTGEAMNGIAHSENVSQDKMLLTGKWWTEMILINFKSEAVPGVSQGLQLSFARCVHYFLLVYYLL